MPNADQILDFKIMIVDDSYEARQYLKLIITSKFGCQIIEAQNGQDALDKIYDNIPGLIILDVMMPIMDGYEFLKKIRADKRSVNIHVIMCSAAGDRNTVSSFVEEGITDYILKPINLPIVYSKIDRIIKKSFSDHMEFNINNDGIGSFTLKPSEKEYFIKFSAIEGALEDDLYTLTIGNEEPRTSAHISDKSIIPIPKHSAPLILGFKFANTVNKRIIIYYNKLN
jgi:DNA-binding response OmpR family regulator